ncbi:Kunitz type trypsin inhibitor / miraculin [Quillaja saponaria]|uniref:Kunitz type trypsin inhibitor / miraculin n=1 Tax=Quillaja saponaria TaxID=32244 RepID=A0AAD7VH40_QUISA|nr:Kunitz type trypsin inhibitor / miraculin [Quillaja saponaria]
MKPALVALSVFFFVLTTKPLAASAETVLDIDDLQSKSSGIAVCIQSMVWKLVKEFTGVWFVSTDGIETPGSERIPSVFTIEQDGESDYKIVFCSTESDVPTLCRALGIYIDEDGKRHLALSDEIKPFTFRFKKAEE